MKTPDDEKILAFYKNAREKGRREVTDALESLYGEDFFKADVTVRVKTFSDAYKEVGAGHPLTEAYDGLTRFYKSEEDCACCDATLRAFLQLRIIAAALNEGWKPRFTKDERRYYPFFWLYTREEIDGMDEEKKLRVMSTDNHLSEYAGFAYAYSGHTASNTAATVGHCLCLKSRELAEYCARQFTHLWADLLLTRKWQGREIQAGD